MSIAERKFPSSRAGIIPLFEYDLLNRLVSVRKVDADTGALRQVVSYRYNHKNLRIERTDDEGTTPLCV